jgi:endonuclease YncB( thermonuclease family)
MGIRHCLAGGIALVTLTACGVPITIEMVPLERERATVVRTIDGDTIEVALVPSGTRAKVRVLVIDSPERGDCGYKEAEQWVSNEFPIGTQVRLEEDPQQDSSDRDERLLRYVYYTRNGVELNLSLEEVRAGWARHYDKYPASLSLEVESAEETARQKGRGLWGLCHIV